MGIPEVEAGWKEITDPSREVNWTATRSFVEKGRCRELCPRAPRREWGRLSQPWFHRASVPKHLCPGVLHQGR